MVKKGLAILEKKEGWQIFFLEEKESDPRVKGEKGKEKIKEEKEGKKEKREKKRKGRAGV